MELHLSIGYSRGGAEMLVGEVALINGFGVLFVILNALGLGLRLPVGDVLAQAFAQWKIVVGCW